MSLLTLCRRSWAGLPRDTVEAAPRKAHGRQIGSGNEETGLILARLVQWKNGAYSYLMAKLGRVWLDHRQGVQLLWAWAVQLIK